MSPQIVFVVGNRPQFIKLLPVWTALRDLAPVLIHTGQHHDANMSDVFFRDLGLPTPDINLGISGGGHGEQTGRLLTALEAEFIRLNPQLLILFGDTNSTLAAALAAVKLHIPIAHIESGPRMNDNFESPEEANRVVTERLANLLFPPNEECLANLHQDGRKNGVHMVGDTMYDTFCWVRDGMVGGGDVGLCPAALCEDRRCVGHSEQIDQAAGQTRQGHDAPAPPHSHAGALPLRDKVPASDEPEKSIVPVCERFGLEKDNYYLLTMHRPYNVDCRATLELILAFLHALPLPVLFPVHPRTKKNMEQFGITVDPQQIKLTDPFGYVEMQQAAIHCRMVISDSGGVPKEAYFARKRCLTLYPHTPWPQLETAGWVRVVDPRTTELTPALLNWEPGEWRPLFGDGTAGVKIADVVRTFLERG